MSPQIPKNSLTKTEIFADLKALLHQALKVFGKYFEAKLSELKPVPSPPKEIQKIEKAMALIEYNIKGQPINSAFVSEMQMILFDGLLLPPDGKGDHTPGEFRFSDLEINNSRYQPPSFFWEN